MIQVEQFKEMISENMIQVEKYNEMMSKHTLESMRQELEVMGPKYTCGTCTRCTADSRCEFFGRYVEKDYNRCFNHSTYVSPAIKVEFKPLSDEIMDRIIEANTKGAA